MGARLEVVQIKDLEPDASSLLRGAATVSYHIFAFGFSNFICTHYIFLVSFWSKHSISALILSMAVSDVIAALSYWRRVAGLKALLIPKAPFLSKISTCFEQKRFILELV